MFSILVLLVSADLDLRPFSPVAGVDRGNSTNSGVRSILHQHSATDRPSIHPEVSYTAAKGLLRLHPRASLSVAHRRRKLAASLRRPTLPTPAKIFISSCFQVGVESLITYPGSKIRRSPRHDVANTTELRPAKVSGKSHEETLRSSSHPCPRVSQAIPFTSHAIKRHKLNGSSPASIPRSSSEIHRLTLKRRTLVHALSIIATSSSPDSSRRWRLLWLVGERVEGLGRTLPLFLLGRRPISDLKLNRPCSLISLALLCSRPCTLYDFDVKAFGLF